jgi:hypothetical protein
MAAFTEEFDDDPKVRPEVKLDVAPGAEDKIDDKPPNLFGEHSKVESHERFPPSDD